MSIKIEANMYLLCRMFNVSYKKIVNEYSGMTIEEIMKTEAKQGNAAAAKFDKEILTNPIKLIELFKLKDPANKFAILSNMNQYDLEDLLPFLEREDLVAGLNFFTKDKLLDMAEDLPKEQLVIFTLQMFSQEQLMQYMPEEQLNKILTSTDLDKNLELKYLKTVKPEALAQMIEVATGQPAAGAGNVGLDGQANFDRQALLAQITELPDDQFKEAMLGMPKQSKKEFVLNLTKENPKLYLSVDADAYTGIIKDKKDKNDIVKAANVIDPKELVKMVAQLPKDLTTVVLTQVDTKKFADVLIDKFKDVLKQIAAA